MRKRDDGTGNRLGSGAERDDGGRRRGGRRKGGGDGKVNFKALVGFALGVIAIAAVCTWLVRTDFRPFDAVAATASDGYRIYEDEVSSEIAKERSALGLDDDTKWADWLSTHGYSDVSGVRKDVIDNMVRYHAIESECKRLGVMPSDDDIDAEVSDYKGTSGISGDDWTKMLSDAGYDEDTYRKQIAEHLMEERLKDAITTDDADGGLESDSLINYVSVMGTYFQHARKVTCIVMRSDEKDRIDEISQEIKDDQTRFDECRSAYSETDLLDGWDVMNDFTSSMSDTLGALGKGDISDVIELDSTSRPLLVIARVDDAYDTDGAITSLDQLPSDLVQAVKDYLADSGRLNAVYSHLDDVVDSLNVQISDTDETKLPYYVEVPTASADNADTGDSQTDVMGDTTTLDGTTYVTQNDAMASGDANAANAG